MTMLDDEVNHSLDEMDRILRGRILWRPTDNIYAPNVVSNDTLFANQLVIMQALRMLLTMARPQ